MAKHKAPTEVTLVGPEEKSALAEFVERHWPKAALIAIVATASILYTQYQKQQGAKQVDESWGQLMAGVEQDRFTGGLTAEASKMQALATSLSSTDAGPWALYLQAQGLHREGEVTEALDVLDQLKSQYPDHVLASERFNFGDSATPKTTVEYLGQVYRAEQEWMNGHPGLFDNPQPPAGAPRVNIKTDQGDILVALYPDRAPKLTENFLKLSGEGFYDGTRFHRVQPGLLIEGGDPASRSEDTGTWGTEGADYTLQKEDTGLSNFPGYLGMVVKGGEEEPNGSMFYFTAGPVHFFNHRYVVFGKVIEGQGVVDAISNAPTQPPSFAPTDPIAILGTEVVPGS